MARPRLWARGRARWHTQSRGIGTREARVMGAHGQAHRRRTAHTRHTGMVDRTQTVGTQGVVVVQAPV